MSNITDMNSAIRRNVAAGGGALAVMAAVVIAPEAATKLAEGEPTKKLWWLLATGVLPVLALLLEGLDLVRGTKHRAAIDNLIVRTIVGRVCSDRQCPQINEPNESVRRVAMGIFYTKIDSPSRDVAFYEWGWYYTSLVWLAMSVGVSLFSFLALWFIPTHHPEIRWPGLTVLFVAILVSYMVGRTWRRKTRAHVQMQLAQIQSQLGTQLAGAECQHPACPST